MNDPDVKRMVTTQDIAKLAGDDSLDSSVIQMLNMIWTHDHCVEEVLYNFRDALVK